MEFIADPDVCYKQAIDFLSSKDPAFLARIGGSDTFVIAQYLSLKATGISDYADVTKWRNLVERYNGFYDKSQSDEKFLAYCEMMLQSYLSSKHLIFCNHQLLRMYFPDWIHSSFSNKPIENKISLENLINTIDNNAIEKGWDVRCYPYPYIERLVRDSWTLFRAFCEVLPGKKVLVISPFAKSIEKNFHNRKSFFKNYSYPDFSLAVYNAPVTYAGLPSNLYPHENWMQTLAAIKRDISTIDFDVALLACGSYAMPIGVHIEQTLSRKAVYVGGVLQMYFGILGRRYDNEFFTDQINRDSFIWPIERSEFVSHVPINEHTAYEAFGAYF